MSLVFDIGQGAGLAGATGVRPFLPPLLAGALARGDIGLDFDGSGWQFLESSAFLLALLAVAVLAYAAERSQRFGVGREPGDGWGATRRAMSAATGALAVVLGALLFAGSLAAGGRSAIPGVVAGLACAALAFFAIDGLLERVRRRLDEGQAALLATYADVAALALAAVAIFAPPVAFLALVAFAALLVRGRGRGERKYAGLRILR